MCPGFRARSPPANARIVQIGEDPLYARYPMRGFPSDLTITASALSVLEALEQALHGRSGAFVEERRARLVARSAELHAQWRGEAEQAGRGNKNTLAWLSHCLREVVSVAQDMTGLGTHMCPVVGRPGGWGDALTEARQGIRMLKFLDVFGRWEAGAESVGGGGVLGMGERTFRRWSRRYEEEGEAGLLDRRIGKASGKRVPVDGCAEVEALYRTRYQGFTARHFHEHLVREHRFAWSYSWTKTFLQSRNLLAKAARRGAPAQAAASSVAWDDAASGCIATDGCRKHRRSILW